jgi:hypothetical protein
MSSELDMGPEAAGGERRVWRRRMKVVLFSLLPALMLLVLLEVASHLLTVRTFDTVRDPDTGGGYYSMRTGVMPWSQRSVTPLNSLGFPDDEFTGIEKGECLHVVFTGDSFTFGDAVDRERNYVSLVKAATRERFPDQCIRMFNIAERMTTIEQQAKRVRETMAALQPDIVILGQYQNDLTDLTNPGSIAFRPRAEDGQSNHWGERLRRIPGFTNSTVRMLTYRTFSWMIMNDVEYDRPLAAWSVLADSSQREAAEFLTGIYRDMYLDLAAELQQRGIAFGAVIFPSKLDVLAKRYPEEEFFLSLAREAGIPHLSLMPRLNRTRDRYTYQMYDGHLSEYGNEISAEEIVGWLYDSVPAPFPSLRANDAPIAKADGAERANAPSSVTAPAN